MQYRTNRLITSYASETASSARTGFSKVCARLKAAFISLDLRLTACWEESLLRRYIIRMGEDTSRSLHLMRPRGHVVICLALCGLMSLGSLVVNPPQAKLSHRVRIDVSRPTVQTLSARDTMRMTSLSAYELAALYAAGTGQSSNWFSSGQLSYEDAVNAGAGHGEPLSVAQGGEADEVEAWQSSRSPLGVRGGQVAMRTSAGFKNIDSLGQVAFSVRSTERPQRALKTFVAGTAEPEVLLAELSLQGADSAMTERLVNPVDDAAPRWQGGRYGTATFEKPRLHWSGQYLAESAQDANFCPQERMEHSSWLNMLYASYTKNSIYTVKQAGHYRPYVERFANHYALQPSLVYAIMRVESGFNPLAISHANALGLMQVVPRTAGNEVYTYLSGKNATPKPEVLFAPESNIEYGTTYLHLLTTRHFGEVKNPISRELCAIAAYNGGPNAVYRVFNRDKNKAVEQINRLSSEELYAKLLNGLSSQETRDYLPKVLSARNDFLRGKAKMQ